MMIAAAVILILVVNAFTVITDYPDAIVSNSAIFSAYIAYTMKQFWDTLNHIQYIKIKSLQQSKEGSIRELLQSLMHWQKRISHYLSSFIISQNYNIDGFFESSYQDTITSTLKIIVMFMTIPMTKNEWVWADNSSSWDDKNKKKDQEDRKQRANQ